jgi:hypothetical protein
LGKSFRSPVSALSRQVYLRDLLHAELHHDRDAAKIKEGIQFGAVVDMAKFDIRIAARIDQFANVWGIVSYAISATCKLFM